MSVKPGCDKRLVFVVNPAAGRVASGEVRKRVREWFSDFPCDVIESESCTEAALHLSALDPEQIHAVVAFGGDGTVNGLLKPLSQSQLPLSVFPLGTANDLCEELGNTNSWSALREDIRSLQIQYLDLIEVENTLFATVGGIGIGSFLTHAINTHRRDSLLFRAAISTLRKGIYPIMTLSTILFGKEYCHRIRLRSDTGDLILDSAAVLVCNQRSLGGSLRPAPRASNRDGLMDILAIAAGSRKELGEGFLCLRQGRQPKNSVRMQTSQLILEELDGRPMRFFGDGEVIESGATLRLRVAHRALAVLTRGPQALLTSISA